MRTTYDKLIRDRIPEVMDAAGVMYEVIPLDDKAFKKALLAKLVEETQEVASAEGDDLIKELADLFEVIDTLLSTQGILRDTVAEKQTERRAVRGGFDKRLKLLWTKEG